MENLENGNITPILLEDLGMKFTSDTEKYKARFGLYQCPYCGKEFECITQSVKRGKTKSCGCQCNKLKNPHGLISHPLYGIWKGMKTRCYNQNINCYKNYGGRGIELCERWLLDFKSFYEWSLLHGWVQGLSIDRIDVDGNYCPENCRWVTQFTQTQNTRDIISSNTSGFRGVDWHKNTNKWRARIKANNKHISLGSYQTALEAAKAYERYVRINNLEHNFTSVLTEDEISELEKLQALEVRNDSSI